jgi:hypothetical protein
VSKGAARRLGYVTAAQVTGGNPLREDAWVAVDTDASQAFLLNNVDEAVGFSGSYALSRRVRDMDSLDLYPVRDLRDPAQPATARDPLPGRAGAPTKGDYEALLRWADKAAFFVVDYTEGPDRVAERALELHNEFVAMRKAFGDTPKEDDHDTSGA